MKRALTLTAGLSIMAAVSGLAGCQSQIAGQTLPSAHYLRDDVQFFPAGDEFLLPNTVQAHEEYKVRQSTGVGR